MEKEWMYVKYILRNHNEIQEEPLKMNAGTSDPAELGQAAEYNKYLHYTKQSSTLLKEESKQTGLPFIQK